MEIKSPQQQALLNHIEGDDARWLQTNKMVVELRAELKQYAQLLYEGTTPVYNYEEEHIVIQAGGLVDLGSQGSFTAPLNGMVQMSVNGLLSAIAVLEVNGETVWASPLGLLSASTSPEIQVNTGDVVTASGVLGIGQTVVVIFAPNKL